MRILKLVIITFSLLFIGFSMSLKAQDVKGDTTNNKLSFGIHSSLSMSTLGGDLPSFNARNIKIEVSKYKPQVWFSLGVYGEYMYTKAVGISVGLQYVKMGSNFKQDNYVYTDLGTVMSSEQLNFELNYVYMPLLINFYLPKRFYIEVGAYSSALITANKGSRTNDPDAYKINYAEYNDVGVIAGFGYYTNRGKIGVRYSLGLLPCINDADGHYYQIEPYPLNYPGNTYDYFNRLLEFYLDVKIF